jgi:hypothetical protein
MDVMARTMPRFAWLLVAACGGSTTVASGPVVLETPSSPWAKILRQGAAWRMESEGHPTITITVASVTTANGVTTAQLSFATTDGEPTDVMLPSTIVLDAKGVRIGNLQFPADGRSTTFPDGRYVTARDGEICYGEGPGADAGPCEDVCDARVCIDGTGITSGLGTWWPDYYVYTRKK